MIIISFFLQGAGNLNNANANELNVGDDGQWNPMEWDRYTQSPLIRTTAKLPTLGVLKNSSNLDAHWFLIPQV